MKVYCTGTARIRHRESGVIYDIESDDLDWSDVGGDERDMGVETHYEAVFEHPELGILTWGLWEYPEGVENNNDTDVRQHVLIADFDYGLEQEDDSEPWADYEAPEDPYTVFMASYHHTGDLLAEHGGYSGAHLLNRMVFSHQITALEAYLGDALINAVKADPSAGRRLIEQDKDLAAEKITLAEIANEPGLVDRKVREYLRSVLYHNLSRVDVLYNIALQFRMVGKMRDKKALFEAVSLRHDCVHRNGFDKDGNQLTLFSKAYVQATADLIRDFVVEIETAIRKRPSESLGKS